MVSMLSETLAAFACCHGFCRFPHCCMEIVALRHFSIGPLSRARIELRRGCVHPVASFWMFVAPCGFGASELA